MAASAIALLAFGRFVLAGPRDKWMFLHTLLAVCALLIVLVVALVPRFSQLAIAKRLPALFSGSVIPSV